VGKMSQRFSGRVGKNQGNPVHAQRFYILRGCLNSRLIHRRIVARYSVKDDGPCRVRACTSGSGCLRSDAGLVWFSKLQSDGLENTQAYSNLQRGSPESYDREDGFVACKPRHSITDTKACSVGRSNKDYCLMIINFSCDIKTRCIRDCRTRCCHQRP
jgi:hypothetical protein